MRVRWIVVCAVAILAAGCTESEPGLSRFTIVSSGQHTLRAADQLDGNLVLLGGHMDIESGARVDGSLAMLSGTVMLDGQMRGNAALINGTLTLGPNAEVDGSVDVGGGLLQRAPGARINGALRTGSDVKLLGGAPRAPSLAERAWRGLVGTLILALLAYTLVRLWPRQFARVASAIRQEPAVSAAVGALTGIVVPALLVLMALTILLIPIAFAGVLVLIGLATYGWVGLALAVGRWAAAALERRPPAAVAAAIGMAVQMVLTILVGTLPVVGGIVTALAVAVALGSAILTGLGARAYPPAQGNPGLS